MSRILVVEDEGPIRDLLVKVLEIEGYSTRGVGSAPEAIDTLDEETFDLVVLDLMLGAASGFEVIGMEEHGHRPGTRVLVLTARASERDVLEGWRHRVDEYRTKPFGTPELLDAIRDTLNRTPEETAKLREAEVRRAELFTSLESVFDERSSH